MSPAASHRLSFYSPLHTHTPPPPSTSTALLLLPSLLDSLSPFPRPSVLVDQAAAAAAAGRVGSFWAAQFGSAQMVLGLFEKLAPVTSEQPESGMIPVLMCVCG